MDNQEIETRFTYHAPDATQAIKYNELRAGARQLAEKIVELTPDSREQALAVTYLEMAIFWANASIARRS